MEMPDQRPTSNRKKCIRKNMECPAGSYIKMEHMELGRLLVFFLLPGKTLLNLGYAVLAHTAGQGQAGARLRKHMSIKTWCGENLLVSAMHRAVCALWIMRKVCVVACKRNMIGDRAHACWFRWRGGSPQRTSMQHARSASAQKPVLDCGEAVPWRATIMLDIQCRMSPNAPIQTKRRETLHILQARRSVREAQTWGTHWWSEKARQSIT